MNRLADIDRIRTHFDGQRNLAYEVTGMGSHNGAAKDSVRCGVEQQFREAFIAAVGNGSSRRGPWEQAALYGYALFLGLVFSQSNPRYLWIGIGY